MKESLTSHFHLFPFRGQGRGVTPSVNMKDSLKRQHSSLFNAIEENVMIKVTFHGHK